MQNIKDMEKRIIVIVMMALIVVIALMVTILVDNSHKVKFEDETMAEMISKSAGVESVDKFRKDDLEKIEELNIGYTGYYDTLSDIEKCPNLSSLIIGFPDCPMSYYPFLGKEMPKSESKERVKKVEKELESILEKNPKLTAIYISNEKGNCELDNIEFLKKGKNLINISLYYQGDIDYSVLSECSELGFLSLRYCKISDLGMISQLENLKYLDLEGTNVAEAEEILNIKNLNYPDVGIEITDTPLAENEEQVELIQNQFPEANIYK